MSEAENPADESTAAGGTLTRQALGWLDELPAEVRPQYLPDMFPRIANRMAADWATPEAIKVYFDDLLLDLRGTRSGFPFEVIDEIADLKRHYRRTIVLKPGQTDPWDLIADE